MSVRWTIFVALALVVLLWREQRTHLLSAQREASEPASRAFRRHAAFALYAALGAQGLLVDPIELTNEMMHAKESSLSKTVCAVASKYGLNATETDQTLGPGRSLAFLKDGRIALFESPNEQQSRGLLHLPDVTRYVSADELDLERALTLCPETPTSNDAICDVVVEPLFAFVGSVDVSSAIDYPITLRNKSNLAVDVTVSGRSGLVAATRVLAADNSRCQLPIRVPAKRGFFEVSAQVTVSFEDGHVARGLQLCRGFAIDSNLLSRESLCFSAAGRGEVATSVLTMHDPGDGTLAILGVKVTEHTRQTLGGISDDCTSWRIARSGVEGSRDLVIEVPVVGETVGRWQGTCEVNVEWSGGDTRIAIPAGGTILGSAYASPAVVALSPHSSACEIIIVCACEGQLRVTRSVGPGVVAGTASAGEARWSVHVMTSIEDEARDGQVIKSGWITLQLPCGDVVVVPVIYCGGES